MPDVPFLPVPLPQQVSFPVDLASLMPAGLQVPGLGAKPHRPPPLPPRSPVRPHERPAAVAPLLLPVAGLP